jgi:hypothetical protein
LNQKIRILNQISAIRDLHPQMEKICLNGSCMNFHVVLRRIYPEAKPYYNINHVITKIGDSYYDITGSVKPEGYSPFSEIYNKREVKRAVNQMMKYRVEEI